MGHDGPRVSPAPVGRECLAWGRVQKAGHSPFAFGPHRTCLGCGSLWCSWLLQLWLCICYPTCDTGRQSTASWSDGRPDPGQPRGQIPSGYYPQLWAGHTVPEPHPSTCPSVPLFLASVTQAGKACGELLAPISCLV